MHSSSGAHYIALDHVRALAALLVFSWHFSHGPAGFPIPFEYMPLAPFALFDEGHTGVALFMTLSGYLFAKLLDKRTVSYPLFLYNRALRLLPLLLVVFAAVAVQRLLRGENLSDYAWSLAQGLLYPTWPNGGWSITVELHFYVLLPLLLWAAARWRYSPLLLVAAAVAVRALLHARDGQVQVLAYWTLVGRIDQFVFGILMYQLRTLVTGRHLLVLAIGCGLVAFYAAFDARGGFYLMPSYPSPSRLWIVLPAIEGLGYATAIAWYDNSFQHSRRGVSALVAKFGEYSYSIYLLHVFVVFDAARFIHERVMDLSNFYVCLGWSVLAFTAMALPGYVSFRWIESPFLRLRRRYLVEDRLQVPART